MTEWLVNLIMHTTVGEILKRRIRRGSIHAVRAYIQLVGTTRMILLTVVGFAVAVALMVTGLFMSLVGLLELLQISPQVVAITQLSLGLVLAGGVGIYLFVMFKEKRWLEQSQSYAMMDAVLQPWPGILPPSLNEFLKTQIAAAITEEKIGGPVSPSRETALAESDSWSRAAQEAGELPRSI
jgi:hypothetical protein